MRNTFTKVSPTYRIEVETLAGEIVTYYVRDRIVIDVSGDDWRTWCGGRIARLPPVGQPLRYLSRFGGGHGFEDLQVSTTSVTALTDEAAAEVWKNWLEARRELLSE